MFTLQDVDGGGWRIASDDLDAAGTARVEYLSSGKGFFAKNFNGGKPFVDDLNVEVDDSGNVQVRSQSRQRFRSQQKACCLSFSRTQGEGVDNLKFD